MDLRDSEAGLDTQVGERGEMLFMVKAVNRHCTCFYDPPIWSWTSRQPPLIQRQKGAYINILSVFLKVKH